jgi:hypothetical protein
MSFYRVRTLVYSLVLTASFGFGTMQLFAQPTTSVAQRVCPIDPCGGGCNTFCQQYGYDCGWCVYDPMVPSPIKLRCECYKQ